MLMTFFNNNDNIIELMINNVIMMINLKLLNCHQRIVNASLDSTIWKKNQSSLAK